MVAASSLPYIRLVRNGPPPPTAGFWAVTCFFNPGRYRRKLDNYRVFRRRLGVPLVAVEHAVDGNFQLGPSDADILVSVAGGDVLWQKERLLNLAVQALPPGCDAVAWLDCDVVFGDPDWMHRARVALDRFGLVHLLHERHNLPKDAPLEDLESWPAPATSISAVRKIETGTATVEDLVSNLAQLTLGSTTGLGWASRRSVLDAHGLYDACILGGADRFIMCAALGRVELARRCQRMSDRRFEHYLAWARPYQEAVGGRVGTISGRVFHLWHGELKDRRYEERFALLERFDPFTDIALDAGGSWRWNSAKPELHAAIRRYFDQRLEDGAPEVEAPA